jgi:hypothetical protein
MNNFSRVAQPVDKRAVMQKFCTDLLFFNLETALASV